MTRVPLLIISVVAYLAIATPILYAIQPPSWNAAIGYLAGLLIVLYAPFVVLRKS